MKKSSGIMNAGLTVLLLLATRSELLGCEVALVNHHGFPCSLPTILKLRGGRTEDKDMVMTQMDDVGVDALDDEFDAAFREVESRARPQRGEDVGAQAGQLARSCDDVLEEVERLVLQHDFDAAELVYMDHLEANGEDVDVMESYALFLWSIRDDVDAAREVFEGILRKERRRVDIMMSYAMFLKVVMLTCLQAGCKDLQGAIKIYEDLQRIYPNEASIYFATALMYHGVEGQEHVYSGDEKYKLEDIKNVTRAVELYRNAIALEPNMTEALTNLATVLFQESINVTESEVLFVRSLSVDPNQTEALIGYAKLLSRVCDIDRASLLFQKIHNVTRSAGEVQAEFFYAYLDFLVRFKAKRVESPWGCRRSHESGGDGTCPALRTVQCHGSSNGDTIGAITLVQKALLSCETPDLLLLYSDLLFKCGKNHDEAVKAVARAMEMDPLNEKPRERYLELFGEEQELIKVMFDRALEFAAAKGCVIWTKRIEAERTSRLIRFAGDQEKEEMKIQLQQLAASYPHDFDLVFSCSTGFLQMKEHALAQRWLKHAVQLRPCSSPALCKLAQVILMDRNDVKAAYRLLKRAYLSDPLHLATSISLGLLYELEGKLKLAHKLYSSVLLLDRENKAALLGVCRIMLVKRKEYSNRVLAKKTLDYAKQLYPDETMFNEFESADEV
ncbi:hypothetical protein GUITHDRAFT_148222 [Guillardia theta CCMP2712]|uniref:Uncharacterized protein n=1 Tax=Guillardia theta (strain CCMP2712) TaxID=905079 RepID=L1I9W7_GUITC|nr:hypothetical protein GUITHDRAFT_148222 [Guillardia theta CCMP2712]EKX33023.1 hypothetical protein GUITHDRAFT_148222 [Guillardia theta CCMP2712]|eukprot:XP_005820003.1 hypothetical protein GUITHDRAFT_148222 [Guillardia theta CCMP2712]